jgi:hypothetical protein
MVLSPFTRSWGKPKNIPQVEVCLLGMFRKLKFAC